MGMGGKVVREINIRGLMDESKVDAQWGAH
jgi:hypothetical protein